MPCRQCDRRIDLVELTSALACLSTICQLELLCQSCIFTDLRAALVQRQDEETRRARARGVTVEELHELEIDRGDPGARRVHRPPRLRRIRPRTMVLTVVLALVRTLPLSRGGTAVRPTAVETRSDVRSQPHLGRAEGRH
jgi:hypothetical protein